MEKAQQNLQDENIAQGIHLKWFTKLMINCQRSYTDSHREDFWIMYVKFDDDKCESSNEL